MEVTAAERTTIYTNISPLAQRVNNYIQTQHSSIAAVAKDIGYSRTTVSRYLTGKYDSNPNDLESKLTDFLTRQTGEAVDLTTPLAKSEGKTWQTPVFFESRDAKAVLGVCQSCQEYIGLGIVVARQWLRQDLRPAAVREALPRGLHRVRRHHEQPRPCGGD